MTELVAPRLGFGTRVGQLLAAWWGAFTGILPHMLHHVGPLAGAAFLAGVAGRVGFFVVGLVAAFPWLRRLHRRFGSWIAPAVAVGLFVATYSLSSFVIGPLISGETSTNGTAASTTVTTVDSHGH